MPYSVFSFETPNLGDDVQALAAALLLPKVDGYVNRDRLDKVQLDEPHHVIMNSWFAVKRYKAVPTDSVIPHYFGMCIGRPELLNRKWLAEWRSSQPIGVRDLHSLELLRKHDIEAYYSGCLTTWMGRFFHKPEKREGIYFVDVPEAMEAFIPADIRDRAIRITNETAKGKTSQIERFRATAKILDTIRTAEKVVTRRLHTALPCVGFETPVTVYLDGNEKNRQRFSGADRFLPMVFHNGAQPIDVWDWIEPKQVTLPQEMEERFDRLLEQFGTKAEPRWNSFAEFVETLPKD
nr:polysaccharide pyruvyl transferase family protein [uncultured Cohaesibacter sp.]